MAKILEMTNLTNKFQVLLEISKKKYGETFNILNKHILFDRENIIEDAKFNKDGKLSLSKELQDLYGKSKKCKVGVVDKKTFIVELI